MFLNSDTGAKKPRYRVSGRARRLNMGRPFCDQRKQASNTCHFCRQQFTMEGLRSTSLKKFMARKYCSKDCADNQLRGDFWSKLETKSNGCRVWTGWTHKKGYGRAEYKGQTWRTHRLAYTLAKGPIPEGMMILHSCDNPPCCNPEHLRAGTHTENMQDVVIRGRHTNKRKAAVSLISSPVYL